MTNKPLHNLVSQRPYGELIGREAELREVMSQLAFVDRAWVVAIEGIAGVGKKALASEVASRFIEEYNYSPPGSRFEAVIRASAGREPGAGAGRSASPSLDDVSFAIATALAIPSLLHAPAPERLKLCWGVLERIERALLIVENVEEDESNQVLAFLANLPRSCKALVTTRFHENADVHVRLGPLSSAATRDLIAREFGAHGITLSQGQMNQIEEDARGLPLAVQLLAGRASQEGTEALLGRRGDVRRGVYSAILGPLVERLEQQRPSAYYAWLACAFFAREAGASREAMAGVLASADEGRADLDYLGYLNLIHDTGERYTELPIVYEYARNEITRHVGWEQHARDRWITYYRRTVSGSRDPSTYDWMRNELPNLEKVIDWLIEHGRKDILAEVFCAAQYFLYGFGQWEAVTKIAKLLLESFKDAQRLQPREVEILIAILQTPIDVYRRGREYGAGRLHIQAVQRLAQTAHDELLDTEITLAHWRLLCNDGTTESTQPLAPLLRRPVAEVNAQLESNEAEFKRDIESALRVFARRKRLDKVIQAYETAGNFYRALENWEVAMASYGQALTALDSASQFPSEFPPTWRQARGAVLRVNKGLIVGRQGSHEEACKILESEYQKVADWVDLAIVQAARAYYERLRGNHEKARASRAEAEDLKRRLQFNDHVFLCREDEEWNTLAQGGDVASERANPAHLSVDGRW